MQFRLDVVNEERHVMRQVKFRHLKNQRKTKNRLSCDPVYFASAQSTDRTCRTTLEQNKKLKYNSEVVEYIGFH